MSLTFPQPPSCLSISPLIYVPQQNYSGQYCFPIPNTLHSSNQAIETTETDFVDVFTSSQSQAQWKK